jgi:hypothetical protein
MNAGASERTHWYRRDDQLHTWVMYKQAENEIIEREFQAKNPTADIQVRGQLVKIDFQSQTQTITFTGNNPRECLVRVRACVRACSVLVC